MGRRRLAPQAALGRLVNSKAHGPREYQYFTTGTGSDPDPALVGVDRPGQRCCTLVTEIAYEKSNPSGDE
jgi:hypothetical protein